MKKEETKKLKDSKRKISHEQKKIQWKEQEDFQKQLRRDHV